MNRRPFLGATLWPRVALCVLLAVCSGAHAGQRVRVSPDLQLYYVEAGRGSPIVFVPGWTGTTEVMQKQIAHFSKRYRAISYDPRSQGRSTQTAANNHYAQHGADLAAFMKALKLKDVVLVAHSSGCLDVYSYFRAHGTANVKAFACIDGNPKDIVEADGDWGAIKSPKDLQAMHDGISYDRVTTTQDFLQSMFTQPLTQREKDWFTGQLMKTPTSVALLLHYDGSMADYSPEARAIDGKIPVLNFLANPGWFDGWTALGKAWLAKNAPHAEVVELGQHFMAWEFPEKFNTALETFVERALK